MNAKSFLSFSSLLSVSLPLVPSHAHAIGDCYLPPRFCAGYHSLISTSGVPTNSQFMPLIGTATVKRFGLEHDPLLTNSRVLSKDDLCPASDLEETLNYSQVTVWEWKREESTKRIHQTTTAVATATEG
jgi:hypothetical protein